MGAADAEKPDPVCTAHESGGLLKLPTLGNMPGILQSLDTGVEDFLQHGVRAVLFGNLLMNGDFGIKFLSQQIDLEVLKAVVAQFFGKLIDGRISDSQIVGQIADAASGNQLDVGKNIVGNLFFFWVHIAVSTFNPHFYSKMIHGSLHFPYILF